MYVSVGIIQILIYKIALPRARLAGTSNEKKHMCESVFLKHRLIKGKIRLRCIFTNCADKYKKEAERRKNFKKKRRGKERYLFLYHFLLIFAVVFFFRRRGVALVGMFIVFSLVIFCSFFSFHFFMFFFFVVVRSFPFTHFFSPAHLQFGNCSIKMEM